MQVREIAMRTGYVPSNVGDRILEVGSVHALQPQQELATTYEGFRSVCTDQGLVVGTRTGSCPGIAFPEDGPRCFYSALFDKRRMFDSLRENFLIHSDPQSLPSTFLTLSEPWISQPEHGAFLESLGAWVRCGGVRDEPGEFAHRAWPSYLVATANPQYFFSVDELLAACYMSNKNAIVFKEIDGV